MATGERPFRGTRRVDDRLDYQRYAPIGHRVNPALPRDIGRIIRRALVKDPEHRYQTVRDLGNDLEDLKRDLDSGELLTSGVSREIQTVRRRPRVLVAVGAVDSGCPGADGWLARADSQSDALPPPSAEGG